MIISISLLLSKLSCTISWTKNRSQISQRREIDNFIFWLILDKLYKCFELQFLELWTMLNVPYFVILSLRLSLICISDFRSPEIHLKIWNICRNLIVASSKSIKWLSIYIKVSVCVSVCVCVCLCVCVFHSTEFIF